MSKDQLRDIDIVLRMNLNWNSFPIIVYRNITFFRVDIDFDEIHFVVSLVIVSSIDKNLIENFVEGRDKCDLLRSEFQIFLPQNPFSWFLLLDTTDIGVRTDEDVLQLSFLLVDLFNCFLRHSKYYWSKMNVSSFESVR